MMRRRRAIGWIGATDRTQIPFGTSRSCRPQKLQPIVPSTRRYRPRCGALAQSDAATPSKANARGRRRLSSERGCWSICHRGGKKRRPGVCSWRSRLRNVPAAFAALQPWLAAPIAPSDRPQP